MAFKIVMNNRFKVSGRYATNILGRVIVFNDGVGFTDSKEVAEFAAKLRHIDYVEPFKELESAVVSSVVIDEVADEVVGSEVFDDLISTTPQELEVTDSGTSKSGTDVPMDGGDETTEEVSTEEPVEDVVEDDSDEAEEHEATPDIQQMYNELGTWKAVSDALGISTTELRKLREEQGLL